MNILSYKVQDNGYILIQTDSKVLPEVCYFVGKFKNFKALKKEIEKKILEVQKRTTTNATQIAQLLLDIDKELPK